MNTQACMGLVQSWPVVSGASSRTYNSKPTGDHSRGTHQLPHFWPLILTPYISQKPLSKKLSPKVLFFPHCPKFWKLFTQRPLIGWKIVPKCPLFLWLLSLKDPHFFALHASVWGQCYSLKHGQKLENFVFLRQNRAIWWILLGANLIKVMKTKLQFYRLNRLSTDPIVMEELHWRAGMIHRSSYPGQTRKAGIYPTPQARSQDRFWGCGTPQKWTFWTQKVDFFWTSPPYPPTKNQFLAHFVAKSGPFGRFGGGVHRTPWLRACYFWFSKQMPTVLEAVRAEAF